MRLDHWNPSDPVVAVVGRVDVDAVADAVVRWCAEEFPAYGGLDPEVLLGPVRDGAVAGTELLLTLVVEQRPPTAGDAERYCRAHRSLTVWGITIEDVIAVLAALLPRIFDHVMSAAHPHELPAVLRAGGQIFTTSALIVDLARLSAAEADPGFAAEERAAGRLLAAARGEAPAPDAAQVLGLDVPSMPVPFVLALDHGGPLAHARAARDLRRAGVLAVTRVDCVVGLAAHAGDLSVPSPSGIVVADAVAAEAIKPALEELRGLVPLVRRLGLDGVVHADELVTERMLAAAPRVAHVIHARVREGAARARANGDELLRTARAFVASDFDRPRTALALGLPPSTLRHRLRRLEDATRLDLRRPLDLCLLAAAIKADALQVDEAHAR